MVNRMCPALPLYGPVAELWKEDARKTTSLASRISNALETHALILLLACDIWKLDSMLKDFLNSIYEGVEKRARGEIPIQPTSPEALREALDTLRGLYTTIEQMHGRAKRIGLTNRRFTGAAFNSVRLRADDILDLVESVEVAMDDGVDAIFDKSLAELKRGEVFDLADIK